MLVLLLTISIGSMRVVGQDHLAEDIHRFRATLHASVDSANATAARIEPGLVDELYRTHFPLEHDSEQLKSYSLETIIALHNATESGVFYTLSPFLLDRLGHLVAELVDRLDPVGASRSDLAQDFLEKFHANLLRARRFSEAKAFNERYSLKAADWVIDDVSAPEAQPTVLQIDSSRTPVTLVRLAADLEEGPKIIAVIHPHCGFSRRAMLAIEGDPALASLFAGQTLWLVDAYGGVPLEPILEWNAAARETKISISYADHEWPAEITFGQVPVFYFFLDGVLRDSVIGWPGAEQSKRLHQAFNAIGVTSAGSSP